MSATTSPEDETERLRRHLRALSAVNRQLHAQLESGVPRVVDPGRARDDILAGADDGGARMSRLSIRRASSGSEWIEQLQLLAGASDPFLARSPKRGAFLVEGPLRRHVKAGMLFVALERVIGPARVMRDAEIDRFTEGPPVEVLEAASGPAFIIVAGRRLPIRGLPLPHPVTDEERLRFPEGEELRVGTGNAGGGKATGGLRRARALVRREGVVQGGAAVARSGARRLLRSARGTTKTSKTTGAR
ncbi:MAG TPA: hypothetical protein VIK54_15330 [Acidimicrobiia bacterium]